MSSRNNLEQLRAAVVDGRTENIRYRQKELQSLHTSLRQYGATIISSISKDSDALSPKITFEAEAEYWLALNAVEKQFELLDFEVLAKQEYLVAKGFDNRDRRVGKGLVIIRPTTHTRFYSVIIALAAAITAGNCIALELAGTMLNVDSVLKELLPQALDPDTFAIINAALGNPSDAFLVDQTSNQSVSSINQLSSNTSLRIVAVVDRTADIEASAKAIVTARFSFQGTSSYSPDLIIVNGFIKNEFVESCSRYAGKFFPNNEKTTRARNNDSLAIKKRLAEAEEKRQVSQSGSGSFRIVDIHDRNSPIAKLKFSGFYLPIIAATSLTDSINIGNSDSNLLALYTFSDAPTAKFLSQHFNAITSYSNRIPSHLLVGPAAPITPLPPPPSHKYSAEMFSSPRPQYTSRPSATDDLTLIDNVLSGFHDPTRRAKTLQQLGDKLEGKKKAVLQPKKIQPRGDQLGFFEQGLVLGAGIFLTMIVSTVGGGIWFLRKHL